MRDRYKQALNLVLFGGVNILPTAQDNLTTRVEEIKKEFGFPRKEDDSNPVKLSAHGLAAHNFPPKYLDFFNARIMTYPVRLDDTQVVDFSNLLNWWSKENKFAINPYTGKPIQTIKVDHELKKSLDEIVECLIWQTTPRLVPLFCSQLPELGPKLSP